MLNVTHIISGDLWAGAEVMACSLLRGFGHYPDLNLSVILLNEGRLANELRNSGLKVQVLDENRHSFPALVQMTHALLQADPPVIIHAHRYKENLLTLLAAGVSHRPYLVSTLHGLPEAGHKAPSWGGRCKSWVNFAVLARLFARTVAVSADIGHYLQLHGGFAADKVAVIHNGVMIPPLATGSADDGAPVFTIGSSGRLFPIKDFPLLVEIARLVIGAEPAIRFELAGEGPERGKLESLIRQHGLTDRFVLRGHLDDVEPFYAGLDLYLNTSLHEGIPMTILEALARAIPVVAPQVGGIREIVDNGVDGFLVAERNPQAFADRCLSLYRDKQLRVELARSAREKATRIFSVESMAAKYYGLYRELVDTKRRERGK